MAPEVSLRCAAILFDLDGVLVDSAACIEGTWRRWALHHQLDPARVIALAHGRRATETLQLVAPHLRAETELAALAASEWKTVGYLGNRHLRHSRGCDLPAEAHWPAGTGGLGLRR